MGSSRFDRHLFAHASGTSALVPQLHVVDNCPSSQDIAKELAESGHPHGTLVVADRQDSGRGRGGRGWTHLDGALAFSLVLRPTAPVSKWVRVTSLAGLALVDTVEAMGGTAQLKWPNDLVMVPIASNLEEDAIAPLGTARKVAGVLVDGVMGQGRMQACVLGIGLNVGTGAIPSDLSAIATTLAAAGVEASRERTLALFCDRLGRRLSALGDDALMRDCVKEIEARSFTLGRQVVDAEGNTGTAVGLDLDGALIIEDSNGVERLVWAGEVSLAS